MDGVYLNDSVGQIVYAYDFDLGEGSISNKRILVDHRPYGGEPDGCVVESAAERQLLLCGPANISSSDGNLWIAVYSSHRIMVYSPAGQHIKDIVFPAANVTCTTWGGSNFDMIFLTTAGDRGEGNLDQDDQGGHMFRFKPIGSRGGAMNEFGS